MAVIITCGVGALEWLNLIYYFSYIKLAITAIKYTPQVNYICSMFSVSSRHGSTFAESVLMAGLSATFSLILPVDFSLCFKCCLLHSILETGQISLIIPPSWGYLYFHYCMTRYLYSNITFCIAEISHPLPKSRKRKLRLKQTMETLPSLCYLIQPLTHTQKTLFMRRCDCIDF